MSGFVPRMRKLSLLLSLCGLLVEWGRHDGQVVQWPRQILAVTPRPSGSLLLIDSAKRRQNVGLRNGLLVLEGYSHKTYLSKCWAATFSKWRRDTFDDAISVK
jgi:hypothetical protein